MIFSYSELLTLSVINNSLRGETGKTKKSYFCFPKECNYAVTTSFFPAHTQLIKDSVGFRAQDGTVYYLHNGNPIYCHSLYDRNDYRFIMANLAVNGLCKICELCEALGEGRKNIERYAKSYREHGN